MNQYRPLFRYIHICIYIRYIGVYTICIYGIHYVYSYHVTGYAPRYVCIRYSVRTVCVFSPCTLYMFGTRKKNQTCFELSWLLSSSFHLVQYAGADIALLWKNGNKRFFAVLAVLNNILKVSPLLGGLHLGGVRFFDPVEKVIDTIRVELNKIKIFVHIHNDLKIGTNCSKLG